MNKEPNPRERLDVETPEERQQRLGDLLSGLAAQRSEGVSKSERGAGLQDVRDSSLKTYAVPQSDALARARAFLPMFKSSTDQILSRAALNPDSVNAEKVAKGEQAVAMDLGLGVYDVKGSLGEGQKGMGPEVEGTSGGKEGDISFDDEEQEEEEEEEGEESSGSESGSDGAEQMSTTADGSSR